jgi:predicted RNA-binding Zn ribbon-like protein
MVLVVMARIAGRGAGQDTALALAFLNTVRRGGTARVDLQEDEPDQLGSPALLRAWLGERGLPTARPEGARSPADERLLLDEAQRLRAHLARAVEAHCAGRKVPAPSLFGINRVLEAAVVTRVVGAGPKGLRLTERLVEEGPRTALGPIAHSAAALLTRVVPSRIRRCASPECAAWFVDTSKGGQRKWCSMARCGNRAKAATHRLRHVGAGEGG